MTRKPQDDAVMPLADVLAKVHMSRSTVYELIKAGKFPAPIRLTDGRKRAWWRSQVDAWLRSRPTAEPRKAERAA